MIHMGCPPPRRRGTRICRCDGTTAGQPFGKAALGRKGNLHRGGFRLSEGATRPAADAIQGQTTRADSALADGSGDEHQEGSAGHDKEDTHSGNGWGSPFGRSHVRSSTLGIITTTSATAPCISVRGSQGRVASAVSPCDNPSARSKTPFSHRGDKPPRSSDLPPAADGGQAVRPIACRQHHVRQPLPKIARRR